MEKITAYRLEKRKCKRCKRRMHIIEVYFKGKKVMAKWMCLKCYWLLCTHDIDKDLKKGD